MGEEPRGSVVQSSKVANPGAGMSNRTSAKPYVIAKRAVWEAYQQVKANRGAAGIDDETIAMFEQNLSKNLYKLWNRMSSGSYLPPPVKQVEIPKAKGGTRKLGIPTSSTNCTGQQIAFGMGRGLPSFPSVTRSALPGFEGTPNSRH